MAFSFGETYETSSAVTTWEGRAFSPERSEEDERRCMHCQSPSLVTDWAAGDRVCTNCGVVGEEHLLDDRPEWREFNDADDLAKGLPAAARCGLVPVDETRYLGGLQPTTLSRQVFGDGNSSVRKRLLSTNRKLDVMMEKQHSRALKTAKVSRQARQRQIEQKLQDDSWEDGVRPEYDHLLLQEEEDAQRVKDALYAEKWSIERAILLHGDETTSGHDSLHGGNEEREDLLQRMDGHLRRASAELYQAYTMLQEASRKLHLPDRVLHEATTMLRRYVTRRDGIHVKGVSSRMSSRSNNGSKDEPILSDKEAAERLREYNKLKQSGALGSALLFLTARKLGWPRSLAEVCSSFQLDYGIESGSSDSFIKPKHCSRAMNEVRALFPNYGRSTGPINTGPVASNADSTGNFVEHITRKLELPPVASASIRKLVYHYRKEQSESGTESETKLSTVCASIAFFVCQVGASLQRLAQQTQKPEFDSSKRQHIPAENGRSSKRVKLESNKVSQSGSGTEESKLISRLFDEDTVTAQSASDSNSSSEEPTSQTKGSDTSAFDVFSHSAVEDQISEKRRYEMRRIWDAWSEQMPWFRNLGRIEQSCGVSRNMVLLFYKKKIFPQRHALLEVLQESASDNNDCSLKDTPLASVLLKNITSAAPLISSKG